jgi:hypothetical protein
VGNVPILNFKLFETYKDSANPKIEGDQFLRWFRINNKTIKNTGGIRPRYFDNLKNYLSYPAFIVLATDDRPTSQNLSEWDDIIDIEKGKISYWGDAKYCDLYNEKGFLAFFGNKNINKVAKVMQKNIKYLIPPVFHFMKKKKGYMFFTGLYVIENIQTKDFYSQNYKIENYQISLERIDIHEIDLNWLHARTLAKDESELMQNNPSQWTGFIQNKSRSIKYVN